MGKIKDPHRVAGNSPINLGVGKMAYSEVKESMDKVKALISDRVSREESPKEERLDSLADYSVEPHEFISTDDTKSILKTKTMVDMMKDELSEEALVKLVVKHAGNMSATIAKPYLFFLLEKYGCGIESSGGFGGFVESGFAGIEKDTNWEEGE